MNQLSSRDLIIGAYTNYNWNQIKYWANSIDLCGFSGDKAMIVYNSDKDTVQRLIDLGFKVWAFNQDPVTGNYFWPHDLIIVVQRFYHLWYYLDQLPENTYRYVISTDVKDVVFQTDPSKWLEKNLGDKDIVACCESLLYKDEPWGADNMQGSYPMIWNRIKNQPIWNCGVQAGRVNSLRDLWLNIWLTCRAGGRPNPDQAAYNLLLNTKAWSNITLKTMSEEGFAAQVGTTVDPTKINNFRVNLLEPEPIWNGEFCCTSKNIPHAILHQWDRIPNWKAAIEQRYG
jgi:hypothetical protein